MAYLQQPAQPPDQPSDQPPPAQPEPQPPPPPAEELQFPAAPPSLLEVVFGPPRQTLVRRRLARTPDMFGDSFFGGGTVLVSEILSQVGTINTLAQLPGAGGGRRLKIGENNKAIPVDRVFFNFNHFHNAVEQQFQVNTFLGGTIRETRDLPLDVYTFGFEKTFLEGNASLELRFPILGFRDFQAGPPPGQPDAIFESEGGEVGNLAVILKGVLYDDESTVLAAGLGVEAPTGSDGKLRVASTEFRIENEAVHLQPFIAWQAVPDERLFFNGFVQLDFATEGNPVSFRDVSGLKGFAGGGEIGRLDPQTLLHVDAAGGYWVHRAPDAWLLTGVAPIVELHYITTLEDADTLAGARAAPFGPSAFQFASSDGRLDLLHLTAGVHLELARDATLRIAGVFPLRGKENRVFDSEVLVQFTLRL